MTDNRPVSPKPVSEPRALAIKLLKFVTPQDGPGFSVQSSLNASAVHGRPSRHTIEYMPGIRSFRVTYRFEGDTITGHIPEHRVACWYPAD